MPSAKTTLRVTISLVVSALFIVFSLRHTDPRAVLSAIAGAPKGPLLGYVAVLLMVHAVRTVRWGLLLAPVGRVGWRRLNSASAIGFMLLAVLPLRLGELGRPLLVSRPSGAGQKLSRSGALASCVVERIIDGISVGVLGIVALHVLATTGTTADRARMAANLVTAGFAAMLVALAVAFVMRERAVALVRTLLTPVSPRIAGRVAHMLDSFVAGLHLGSAGRVLAVLVLTVIHWLLHVWGFWMVAPAFGIPLTALMASTVLAANVVGVMIPAGPGGLGPSQLATLAGVSIFYPAAMTTGSALAVSGVAYAMAIWALQFLQAVGLGLVFLLGGHVSLAGLFEPPERLEASPEASATQQG
jgi:uncharacterized protein (TIRG00374 family)